MNSFDLYGFKDFPYSLAELKNMDSSNKYSLQKARAEATFNIFGVDKPPKIQFSDLHNLYQDKLKDFKIKANDRYKSLNSFFDLTLPEQLMFSESTIMKADTRPYLFIPISELTSEMDSSLDKDSIPSYIIFLVNERKTDPRFELKSIRVPGYYHTKILGEGAFGLVLEAVSIKTGEKYADKLMKGGGDLNEIDIISRFDHPNLLKVDKIDQDELGRMHVILPLAKSDLSRHTFTSDDQRELFMYQILSGLYFLHKNGYYHCDLKPNNILVESDTKVVVADFGWVYPYEHYQPICGTPGYASPQGWAERPHSDFFDEDIDHEQSDIWSLGAVWYFIMTGKPLVDWRKGLEKEYRSYEKRLEKEMLDTKDTKRFGWLKLISDMTKASQYDRVHSFEEIFKYPGLKARNWSSSIPGKIKSGIISKDFGLKKVDGISLGNAFENLADWTEDVYNKTNTTLLTRCITLELLARVITLAKSKKDFFLIGCACVYIASALVTYKFEYSEINNIIGGNCDEKETQDMVLKIVFFLNGVLRIRSLYDEAVSADEVRTYLLSARNDWTFITYDPKELHESYVNSIETPEEMLSRTSKMG